MERTPSHEEVTWTLVPIPSAAGVDLVLTIPGAPDTTISLALDQPEARALARGILAAAGDATERTFPRPSVTEP